MQRTILMLKLLHAPKSFDKYIYIYILIQNQTNSRYKHLYKVCEILEEKILQIQKGNIQISLIFPLLEVKT